MLGSLTDARVTAYHEAGHGLVAIKRGLKIRRVAIAPQCSRSISGVCELEPGEHLDFDYMVALSAGVAAQRTYAGFASVWSGAGDVESLKLALSRRYGREVKDLDLPIIGAAKVEAERLVDEYWNEIKALAAALIERFEIVGQGEIEKIIATARGRSKGAGTMGRPYRRRHTGTIDEAELAKLAEYALGLTDTSPGLCSLGGAEIDASRVRDYVQSHMQRRGWRVAPVYRESAATRSTRQIRKIREAAEDLRRSQIGRVFERCDSAKYM